ncbi:MAG: homoserine kinase [Anaerolineae bacterium]
MPTNARAEAFAPASMANVGVGFDILGLALCEPGDTVIVEPQAEPGVVIVDIEGDGGLLPKDPLKNTASVAALAYLQMINAPHGVRMILKKDLPLGSGLGSSAASAVAAVVATNALFGEPLAREALLPACLEGEALVSGYHADNAGPSLLGGITLISSAEMSDIRRLPVPHNLHLAMVTPNVSVLTAEARAVLPAAVPLSQMIAQTGAVARLVDAIYRSDIQEMGHVMEQDGIIEPARAHLMPRLYEAREVAKQKGSYGLVISGAGPTLCAVCDTAAIAAQTAAALQALYDEAGIGAVSRATRVDEQGARVLNVI